ncbi:MAG: GIY-YIG nuclease family protein [bacterium]|nr:GIY-YIG nuclease family protein [bacterium]
MSEEDEFPEVVLEKELPVLFEEGHDARKLIYFEFIMQILDNKKQVEYSANLQHSVQQSENDKTLLNVQLQELQKKLLELDADSYFETRAKIDALNKQYSDTEQKMNFEIQENNSTIARLQNEISALETKNQSLLRQTNSQERKLKRTKELYKSVDYCINTFLQTGTTDLLSDFDESDYDNFAPSIILKLHCMDIKDLRKAYTENTKAINQILDAYAARYTTKANQAIYQLMVIALRAELQNILYNLKYEKLDKAVDDVKKVTTKYLKIAGDGNQSIVGTLTRFIGEIEYLFIDAVKIEYNYYVKKEQARQEQLAIKQQMREEAEERKALELQRKKVEQEEAKYQAEIQKATETLSSSTDDSQIAALKSKILELQGQLSNVTLKKDEISKLQNGKAGNVYIISNLGAFGENIFKIGMTRRMNPQDRVDELGSASVPFKFDVHSFIFSDDAVGLENKLHSILNDKRVNKVNMRKEFFYATLDELEDLVNQLDPTAEFTKTMLAEEFRQSQSTDTPYTVEYHETSDENASDEDDE